MGGPKYASVGDDAPEVVPNQEGPEVVKYESELYPQRQSGDQPEALHVAAYDKQAYEYYGGRQDDSAPEVHSSWSVADGSNGGRSDEEAITSKTERDRRQEQRRRICGVRRVVFVAIVVIVILVIIGAVVGGVLGAVLDGSNSKSGALQATPSTGLATTVQNGTLYQYFQLPDGSLVENTYINGDWSLKAGSNFANAIASDDAASGSPIAAISYSYDGQNYRQIFYLNAAGFVRTTNRTETGTWSILTTISKSSAWPGSIGMAACWDNQKLDGIRVYYASGYGWIQEIGGYFNGSHWKNHFGFPNSDPQSGVACTIQNEPVNEYLNVYYRDPRNSSVTQKYWNFKYADSGWLQGPVSGKNHIILSGSDIAVASDNVQTNYVFYQAPNGVIQLGINNPSRVDYETFTQRQSATPKTKLAAAYFDEGALVVFQNSSSTSAMWASDVSRTGSEIFNIAVG